jgi:serine/threonine protein kinase
MHANGVVHRAVEPANVIALAGFAAKNARADETVRIKLLGLGRALGLGEQFVRVYCHDLLRRVSARQTPILSWADELRNAVGIGRVTPSLTLLASAQSSPPRVDPSSSESASDDGTMPRVAAEPSRYEFQVCAPLRSPSSSRVYSAPEVNDRRRFRPTRGPAGGLSLVVDATVVIDAYSVGAVLAHLLTGVPPCDKVADGIARETTGSRALLRRIASACAGRPPRTFRYMAELRDVDGHDLVRLLGALMDKDPATRMTITQLCQHPWLAGAAGEQPAATLREEPLAGVRE